jgi:putative hydrolase of the HAD superfamily
VAVDAVFFDVGNTLVYPHPSVAEVVRQILAEEGHVHDLVSIEQHMPLVDEYYEDRYREDDTFWTSEEATSAVWIGMYSLLARELGIAVGADRIGRRVYDEFGDHTRWRAYSDVAPAFERLASRGIRIGLISNWDSRLATVIRGLGLDRHIDTVVSSADVGLHKPDPRIFELACGRLGVTPERAAHVGDHPYADVFGAESVGMTPVLIDRHDGDHPGAVRFLRTLDDLECVLSLEDGVPA